MSEHLSRPSHAGDDTIGRRNSSSARNSVDSSHDGREDVGDTVAADGQGPEPELTDTQWERAKKLWEDLPATDPDKKKGRPPADKDRRVLEAALYRHRTGVSFNNFPIERLVGPNREANKKNITRMNWAWKEVFQKLTGGKLEDAPDGEAPEGAAPDGVAPEGAAPGGAKETPEEYVQRVTGNLLANPAESAPVLRKLERFLR